MTYRVFYGPAFRDDVRRHVAYLKNEGASDAVVERWFAQLFDLIDSLDQWPRRYPIDPDYDDGSGRETHKANFGDYLVFYEVDEPSKRVNVLAFMHGARRQ